MIIKEIIMKRRKHDEQFKKMIVELCNNGASVLDIADEYGIQNSLIYKWIHIYNNDSPSTTTSTEVTKLKTQVKSLEKQLKHKEMEVDILKKASAIFIQQNDKK